MNKKNISLIMILLLILAVGVTGCDMLNLKQEPYSISGKVVSETDNSGISDIKLNIEGHMVNTSVTTDDNGNWSLSNINAEVSIIPVSENYVFDPDETIINETKDDIIFTASNAMEMYSVDIQVNESELNTGERGNIFLSRTGGLPDDVSNNEEGVLIEFWKASDSAIRVGIKEVLTPGEYDPGTGEMTRDNYTLQIRRDINYDGGDANLNFSLKKGLNNGKFMLYVNDKSISTINWNTEQEPKTTNNILYGSDFSVIFNGWGYGDQPENGKIVFFDNFPDDLHINYLNENLQYNYSNEFIK